MPVPPDMRSSKELRQRSVDMFLDATPALGASIEQYRAGFEALLANFPPEPGAEITSYDADGVRGLKIVMPESAPGRLVIHFHSGGYVMGSPEGYRNFATRLAREAEATVILPGYRLAPEHPYPAPVDDALKTYHWACKNWDVANIIVSGDSAGGGLMTALLLALRDGDHPMPKRAVAISPLLDLAGEGKSMQSNEASDPLINQSLLVGMGKVYIGEIDPHEHPLASPLWGKHHGLPPFHLTASNSEVMRDDAVRLADSIRRAGGKVSITLPDDMIHVWTIFPFLEEAKTSMKEIGAFIRGGWAA